MRSKKTRMFSSICLLDIRSQKSLSEQSLSSSSPASLTLFLRFPQRVAAAATLSMRLITAILCLSMKIRYRLSMTLGSSFRWIRCSFVMNLPFVTRKSCVSRSKASVLMLCTTRSRSMSLVPIRASKARQYSLFKCLTRYFLYSLRQNKMAFLSLLVALMPLIMDRPVCFKLKSLAVLFLNEACLDNLDKRAPVIGQELFAGFFIPIFGFGKALLESYSD